jgi:alpha-glucosidase
VRQIANRIIEIKDNKDHLILKTDGPIFKVLFLTEDIVRIRCSFDKTFAPEASYILVMTAWEDKFDHLFEGERKKVTPVAYQLEESDRQLILSTNKIKLVIHKIRFGIDIYDNKGQLVHSDIREKAYSKDRLGRIYHYSRISDKSYYYGFGEKTGEINKFRRVLKMSNRDTPSYDPVVTDPLYKHIPFYITFDESTKTYRGLFYHNTYDSVFDMGCDRSGYWNKYCYYSADGGEIDLFFIYGPSIKEVVRKYTDLTGKTAMPPLYSLGYLGSTMYYTELDEKSDQAILGFAEKAKKERINCDGFFLSSGYTSGEDGKRYVFNWNYKKFDNPKVFIESMLKKGMDVIPNIKPGMLVTHPMYAKFDKEKAYIRTHDDQCSYTDRFWGGMASFVDFTNPKAREIWKSYIKQVLLDKGINAIWNDNCEFEINDDEAICDFEGEKTIAASVRAVQPNLMALSAVQALLEHNGDRRPFVMNRAGGAGIQRYAQTWSGDNYSNWETLKYSIPLMLGMGLSGVANQGSDVGGFEGPAPEPELFIRWIQNGIFQPRFCIHSCNNDNTVTEPWMYPNYTEYVRKAINLRYTLIPYLYSLMYQAATFGDPIMRPLFYEFDDPEVYEESFNFMLGDYLLIANVLDKGQKKKKVYLPQGSDWYYWDNYTVYKGGQTVEIDVTLDTIPVFIRQGAIIPLTTGIHNLHMDVIDKLNILIDASEGSEFIIYEDDGKTNRYLTGEYCKVSIKTHKSRSSFRIVLEKDGTYHTNVKEVCLDVLCCEKSPNKVYLDGKRINMYLDTEAWENSDEGWYFDNENRIARIKYNRYGENHQFDLEFNVKDVMELDTQL